MAIITATALTIEGVADGQGLYDSPPLAQGPNGHFDVLVYGATSGGVVAAIAASRHRPGVKVGLLVANGGGCGPSEAGANHIGGMTTACGPFDPSLDQVDVCGLLGACPHRLLTDAFGADCMPQRRLQGGLGKTDIGAGATTRLVGGVAGEFYSRVAAEYNSTAPPHCA